MHWLAGAHLLLKPTASSPITCNQYNLFISVHLSASIHTGIFLCSTSLKPFIWKCVCVLLLLPFPLCSARIILPAPHFSPSSLSVHTCPSSLYWGKPFFLQRNISPPPFLPPVFWLLCTDSPPTMFSIFLSLWLSCKLPRCPTHFTMAWQTLQSKNNCTSQVF